ncbi:SPX domain-containing protein [Mycena venus]|uniref:SPX domain-containing protein n=1 Tax=Mycena venus TaxID=2733690 RepID=A0A8H7DAX0_9AGAR|nr:SPX domain-containing protein [Mycena venus]
MAPAPVYPVFRRRSLRRPICILVVLCIVVFLGRFMRDLAFDAQHSTRIAFKYAAGRAAPTVTHTVWGTRTVIRSAVPAGSPSNNRLKRPKFKPKKEEPLGAHTYLPNGLLSVNSLAAHPIPELITRAEAAWAAKLSRASTTLRQAVAEYTRRYNRLPPRGFDKWWAYAAAHNVALPDEYDQIDRDLAPFYGVDPVWLQGMQREWEAHVDSYTIGKDVEEDALAMLNFTLPADEGVRLELASGGFQIIELLREVEAELPPFRAVFSPHDNPNLVIDVSMSAFSVSAPSLLRVSLRLGGHVEAHGGRLTRHRLPFEPALALLFLYFWASAALCPLLCSSSSFSDIHILVLTLLFFLSDTVGAAPAGARRGQGWNVLSFGFGLSVSLLPRLSCARAPIFIEAPLFASIVSYNGMISTRPTRPPTKYGWLAACPPLSPAWLDVDKLPPPFDNHHPNGGRPTVPGDEEGPKTFIHDHLRAMDPCLHPAHLRAHGAYLAHGAGPTPHHFLVPQFSYSVTPLHADLRVPLPVNWWLTSLHFALPYTSFFASSFACTSWPSPPLGFFWDERVDARLQWRGSNTGIWHAADGRWREAHRVRLAALGAGMGGANVSLLDPGMPSDNIAGAFGGRAGFRAQGGEGVDVLASDEDDNHDVEGPHGERSGEPRERTPVGPPIFASRARLLPALLDVAFAGRPLNCEAAQCAVLQEMFEWRKAHDLKKAARYKYVIDVDGNGWSSRFKRLMNSGSLIFKATTYPEWFTDRLAPWVHYVPIQNSYVDLLDALMFFRAHDKAGARIAAAGREWSRRYWRQEDLVAYMYRLLLEYARVMGTDRAAMSFQMWDNEREDAVREMALMAHWERKGETDEE